MTEKKQDKYLTEMKELPPSYTPGVEKKSKESVNEEPETLKSGIEREETPQYETRKKEDKSSENKSDLLLSENTEKKEKRTFLTYKDIILGIVNLVSIVFFIIILVNFPEKSEELRDLRIKEIKNNITVGVEVSEIEAARPKAEYLKKLFLDESGVVGFVNDIELQKREGGAISKVTFAGQNAVADRTGNFGIPIVIELIGSWQAIDEDLQKIDELPYLLRPVRVEIKYDDKDPQVVIYKYGVFLYVQESLGKTR